MLSRKQIWRKVNSRPGRTLIKHLNSRISSNFLISDDIDQKLLTKTKSMREFQNIISYEELTSQQEFPNKKSKGSKSMSRNVKFSTITKVKFIPTRSEMTSLFKVLYWSQEEYDLFKQETVKELWKAMKLPDDEKITDKNQNKNINLLRLLNNSNKINEEENIDQQQTDNIYNMDIVNNIDLISFEDDNNKQQQLSDADVEILNKSIKTMRRVDSVQLLCSHNINNNNMNRQIKV